MLKRLYMSSKVPSKLPKVICKISQQKLRVFSIEQSTLSEQLGVHFLLKKCENRRLGLRYKLINNLEHVIARFLPHNF